jgi:hypothetical protein
MCMSIHMPKQRSNGRLKQVLTATFLLLRDDARYSAMSMGLVKNSEKSLSFSVPRTS